MAQHELDREDLMREAVALSLRSELSCSDFQSLITVGFRANSGMSIFVGQDPVYHFDAEGRLRRAFVDGLLYRSQHTTLAQLQRERTLSQTLLLRIDLDESALQEFRKSMHELLNLLLENLITGRFCTVRSIPDGTEQVPQIMAALSRILDVTPWLSTAINRRR